MAHIHIESNTHAYRYKYLGNNWSSSCSERRQRRLGNISVHITVIGLTDLSQPKYLSELSSITDYEDGGVIPLVIVEQNKLVCIMIHNREVWLRSVEVHETACTRTVRQRGMGGASGRVVDGGT